MLEALRRGSNKLPGRQKIAVSVKFGFTKYTHYEIDEAQKQGLIVSQGNHIQVQGQRGSLKNTILFKKLNSLLKEEEQEEDESEKND